VQFKINYNHKLNLNSIFRSGRSLYWPFQESDVYFMPTPCGRPQAEGSGSCERMWTGGGSQKSNILWTS